MEKQHFPRFVSLAREETNIEFPFLFIQDKKRAAGHCQVSTGWPRRFCYFAVFDNSFQTTLLQSHPVMVLKPSRTFRWRGSGAAWARRTWGGPLSFTWVTCTERVTSTALSASWRSIVRQSRLRHRSSEPPCTANCSLHVLLFPPFSSSLSSASSSWRTSRRTSRKRRWCLQWQLEGEEARGFFIENECGIQVWVTDIPVQWSDRFYQDFDTPLVCES